MRETLTFLLFVLSLCCSGPAAADDRRHALVIGNSLYAEGALANSRNDAALIAETLEQVGFEVTLLTDADRGATQKAILDFRDRLQDTDGAGLFYFAGHGVQVFGRNFLIPVDANIDNESDLATEAISVDLVLHAMERGGGRINIVVLDAARSHSILPGIRSLDRGLAGVNPPLGTYVAFASEPGSVASDENGANSSYAEALAEAIETPGLRIDQVFRRTRLNVVDATGERQVPWSASSLTGEFYFQERPTEEPTPKTGAEPSDGVDETEILFWQSVQDRPDADALQAYLQRYPDGAFAELARLRLRQLREKKTAYIEPEPGDTDDELLSDDDEDTDQLQPARPDPPPPAPAGGETAENGSRQVSRHPTIEAPDVAVVGKRFPVQFWLTEELMTPEVEVKPLRDGAVGEDGLTMQLPAATPDEDYWDIDVTLWAPGFDLGDDGEWNRTLRLYAEGDSDPLLFQLVAAAGKPERRLHFRLYHEGRYLGGASRAIAVREPAATRVHSPAPAVTTLAEPAHDPQPDPSPAAIDIASSDDVPDMQVAVFYEHDEDGVPVSGHINIISRLRPGHIVSEKFTLNPGTKRWLDDTYARFVALGSQLRGAFSADGDGSAAPSKSEMIHIARTRGRELYDHHVPRAFKTYFWTLARTERERFRSIQITTNDPLLPWELVRPVSEDGAMEFDFLALEFDLARWALRQSSGQRDVPPQAVLFNELSTIAPSYTGQDHLPFQKVEIDALSKIMGFRKIVGDFESIEALMNKPINGIVHFTGHGEATPLGTGRPAFAIRLENDRTLGSDTWLSLAASGKGDHPFYFFNACDTGRSRAIGGFVQGWGPTLLASGASGFIGGLWPLLDHSAAAFSADFYRRFSEQMADGPIRVASLLSGVRRRFLETGDPTYLAYTFYGDVNLRFYVER